MKSLCGVNFNMKYALQQRSSQWLESVDLKNFRTFISNLKMLQPYDEDHWKQFFTQTELYHDIKSKLPVSCKEIWTSSGMPGNKTTPRENQFNSYFNFNTFYYLYSLFQDSHTIYDLGCGANLFKPFAHKLIGIDCFHIQADIDDMIDDDFVKGHQEYFYKAFAINSLHFIPLTKLQTTIENFYSMIKVGGQGFITFTLANMVELTNDADWQTLFKKMPDQTNLEEVVNFVNDIIWNLPYNYTIVDHCYFLDKDYGKLLIGNPIDGNIRLLIQR